MQVACYEPIKIMENILEQLILNGFAKKDFETFDGKLKYSLKTLNGGEQLEIEDSMADIKGTPAFIVHNFNLRMLAYSLISYQDKQFEKISPEKKFEFVKVLDTAILDSMSNNMKDFYQECKKLSTPEGIADLSKTPSADFDSKQ